MSAGSIAIARRIVATHQSEQIAGCLVDATTAHAIVTVVDALGAANRARLDAMPIERAGILAWKLLERVNAR